MGRLGRLVVRDDPGPAVNLINDDVAIRAVPLSVRNIIIVPTAVDTCCRPCAEGVNRRRSDQPFFFPLFPDPFSGTYECVRP